MTDQFPPDVVDRLEYALAIYISRNRMPHMSGDPRNRLHPGQRRDLTDMVRAAISEMRALGYRRVPEGHVVVPREATEEPES